MDFASIAGIAARAADWSKRCATSFRCASCWKPKRPPREAPLMCRCSATGTGEKRGCAGLLPVSRERHACRACRSKCAALDQRQARVRLRVIDSEKDPGSTIATIATFVVEYGKRGARPG